MYISMCGIIILIPFMIRNDFFDSYQRNPSFPHCLHKQLHPNCSSKDIRLAAELKGQEHNVDFKTQ